MQEKGSSFRKVTAETIAKENNIEYLPETIWSKMDASYKEAYCFYAVKGKYILFHPSNDGKPMCPFEWYFMFDGKEQMIMDNQSAFKNITNLSDILLQMTRLYSRYIDDDVIIEPYGFALKLEDEVCPDYIGKASLIITDSTIVDHKVKKDEFIDAKKHFINAFLDQFIGWNFGVIVRKDKKLEKELLELNKLVISKDLKVYTGFGIDIWCTEDVQQYKFRKK